MASRAHVQRVRILYKTILRLHRGLPAEIQSLGDNYVRDEFRRHKKCIESEAIIFLHEWTDYAVSLAEQLGLRGPHTAKPLGKYLKKDDLEKLRDDQVRQLYELMIAAMGKTEDNISE
ncbi:succinate dehydrogenase assembly factor 3, mitochondrial [Harpegnathos saltator]|uniref:Succinate dehydrogenase assembly factor 3 n=1 Tax=Harpegnathos saltator TaxID=610380 RepID=E2B2T3_HARSA|nr:succinate dehydrogenase assembly factor 3, mitochondrial [Harpegnathos saltator]EFN89998.1 Protein ACN9-like protein, mitochondrial [Harpegnathos saltator]